MPEAVIVSTARSPIGRANKGSLVDLRPDDFAATIVTAALAKVPQLAPRVSLRLLQTRNPAPSSLSFCDGDSTPMVLTRPTMR